MKTTKTMTRLLFGSSPVLPCAVLTVIGTAACGGQGDDVALPETAPVGLQLEAPPGIDDVSVTQLDEVVDKHQCLIDRDDRATLLALGGGRVNPIPDCGAFCPQGSYVYGVALRSQAFQGNGDDHGITGVLLSCNDPETGANMGMVGREMPKGSWGSWTMCPATSHPMVNATLRYDGITNGTDDFGATQLNIGCGNGTETLFYTLPAKTNTDKGTWLQPGGGILGRFCPVGEAVCGVEVSVGSDGSNDQIGIDLLNFHCCEKD